jgi:hypothetical protein
MTHRAAVFLAGQDEPLRYFYTVEAAEMFCECFASFYTQELTVRLLVPVEA